ncbi:MAG: DNA polymerase IV [Desulfovibrionaceae bacterium]
MRTIMHIDMDAFFASVEQLDHPAYRGKPVVVGMGDRGVVSACSYEARVFGVHSAMPIFQARRLCPQCIFTPVRMARYAEVSRRIMAVLDDFSPLVEQASVDEAYLDVTGMERLFGPPQAMAAQVKAAVREATGLACSIGIAPVKFLAKIASDVNKPDGIFVLEPDGVAAFLAQLPVGRIPGVGKRTLATLSGLGVRTAGDVLRNPPEFWERRFGKWGIALYERAKGQDDRPVEPYSDPKSESAENTFAQDEDDLGVLHAWLLRQSERVAKGLRGYGVKGRTVTLKAKYADFTSLTRSRTLREPTQVSQVIFETACALLAELHRELDGAPGAARLPRKLRLIGVGVSHFDWGDGQVQLRLDMGAQADGRLEKLEKIDKALDAVRGRFGGDAITRGRLFGFTKKDKT